MAINESNIIPEEKWSLVTDTPIFQVLSINRNTKQVNGIPVNLMVEKDMEKVKLVFIDNYIYADHQYKQLPSY